MAAWPKAYKCNVLEKESMEACHQAVLQDLGPCDILINGAGRKQPPGYHRQGVL